MSHYFLHDENLKSDEYDVKYSFNNVEFNLVSNNGVFSKMKVDEGSYIFIRTLLQYPLNGHILDLGCGYGVIGITLKNFKKELNITFSDVNSTCVDLTLKNLARYNLNEKVVLSDGFNNINELFDYIVFNPPIRIGKEAIYRIYKEAYIHLNKSGHFLIVIRKDKGAISHKTYLKTFFSEVKLIERERGYYVFDIIK